MCRIFLDVCCLNRPFDDRTQSRIALESQAILEILNLCQRGTYKLITSVSLETEINQTPNLERREKVKSFLSLAKIKVINSQDLTTRMAQLQQLGLTFFDAAHVASAEKAKADIFLSTDDRLVKKTQQNSLIITVKVNNPVQWLLENNKEN